MGPASFVPALLIIENACFSFFLLWANGGDYTVCVKTHMLE